MFLVRASMLFRSSSSLLFSLLVISIYQAQETIAQHRSILHWKQDLEYKLNYYANQVNSLKSILDSSIYPIDGQPLKQNTSPLTVVTSRGNVHFSDLIIPRGNLIMEPSFGQSAVKVMAEKTNKYVDYKMTELFGIKTRLDLINKDLSDPNHRYIYKGLPKYNQYDQSYSAYNFYNTTVLPGTWSFKQFSYGSVIDAQEVAIGQINYEPVDKVIQDVYMESFSNKMRIRDSQSRLFFEGKKTFYHTIFENRLKSGCCDRLKPIHTNRVMTKRGQQDVRSPVLFVTPDLYQSQHVAVGIQNLNTNYLVNRQLINPANNQQLIPPSQVENVIQLNNLINIRLSGQPEIFKTLVFKDLLMVDDASLSYSFGDNRLKIGYKTAINEPLKYFDLSHENYLLKMSDTMNNLTTMQQVAGRVVVQSESHFLSNLDAQSVNMIENFNSFVLNNLIRIDRASIISAPIQFDALPTVVNNQASNSGVTIQSVPIITSGTNIEIGLLNGMRIPQDLVFLPPHPAGLRPGQVINLSGSRNFINSLNVQGSIEVRNLINGIRMPDEVIPLESQDFNPITKANLAFPSGISVQHLFVQGGQFDEISLKDVNGDAANLIFRSVFPTQQDGSQLIRAPLRVQNLRVFGHSPDDGLLNGFRPEQLLEFSRHPTDRRILLGRKTFLRDVQANECIFNDINQLGNWTNHLIRIDRPDAVQVVHKKLAFLGVNPTNGSQRQQQLPPGSITINRLNVDFHPNQNPTLYKRNVDFSPEFYILQQSLRRASLNNTEGRYRVLDRVQLFNGGNINGIDLNDIVTLDASFKFSDKFTLVGKVEIRDTLVANRVQSNYPIDVMDLIQFNKYRIPIASPNGIPIRLTNLVLSTNNQASFVQCQMLNGISFTEFASSIMSLTQPQIIDDEFLFTGQVNFEGLVRSESSLNGQSNFKQFANVLKNAKYSFENGLQCNNVIIRT